MSPDASTDAPLPAGRHAVPTSNLHACPAAWCSIENPKPGTWADVIYQSMVSRGGEAADGTAAVAHPDGAPRDADAESRAPSATLRAVQLVRAELVLLLGPLALHLRTRGRRVPPATAMLLLMTLFSLLCPLPA